MTIDAAVLLDLAQTGPADKYQIRSVQVTFVSRGNLRWTKRANGHVQECL